MVTSIHDYSNILLGKQIADDALLYIIDTKKITIHINIPIYYQSMFGNTNKAKFSSYIIHLLIIGL
jgi:hypothetical protein